MRQEKWCEKDFKAAAGRNLSDWWEQKYKGGITASVLLLLRFARLAGRCEVSRVSLFPTVVGAGREGCLTSTADGLKKKIEYTLICQVASARQEMHV